MRYSNQQIRENIRWFIEETNQPEIYHVIPFCLGYYGYITKQIWDEIFHLHVEGVIKF